MKVLAESDYRTQQERFVRTLLAYFGYGSIALGVGSVAVARARGLRVAGWGETSLAPQ